MVLVIVPVSGSFPWFLRFPTCAPTWRASPGGERDAARARRSRRIVTLSTSHRKKVAGFYCRIQLAISCGYQGIKSEEILLFCIHLIESLELGLVKIMVPNRIAPLLTVRSPSSILPNSSGERCQSITQSASFTDKEAGISPFRKQQKTNQTEGWQCHTERMLTSVYPTKPAVKKKKKNQN